MPKLKSTRNQFDLTQLTLVNFSLSSFMRVTTF